MCLSKDIQEQLRDTIVDIHQAGKVYNTYCKALELQETTARTIILQLRRLETVEKLVVGLPKLFQEYIKNSFRR